MFDINPNKNLIRFKRIGMYKSIPIEPLFFSNSRIKHLRYNNKQLFLGIILHSSDTENKYDLFNALTLCNKTFNLMDSTFSSENSEYIWKTDIEIKFNYKERIAFYVTLL